MGSSHDAAPCYVLIMIRRQVAVAVAVLAGTKAHMPVVQSLDCSLLAAPPNGQSFFFPVIRYCSTWRRHCSFCMHIYICICAKRRRHIIFCLQGSSGQYRIPCEARSYCHAEHVLCCTSRRRANALRQLGTLPAACQKAEAPSSSSALHKHK